MAHWQKNPCNNFSLVLISHSFKTFSIQTVPLVFFYLAQKIPYRNAVISFFLFFFF